MERANRGGWLYIMADRYRGAMYVGVTAHFAARAHQHRTGKGSAHCAEHQLIRLVWAEFGEDITALITHEKCMKRWRREWKFALFERGNPNWRDLFDKLT